MTDDTKQIRLPEGLDPDAAADVLHEYARTDDAQIIDEETLANLRDAVTEAKEAFAAVLAEQSPQSAETLARQDMAALTEPFRDDEGDIDVDTLRQTPETGDADGSGDASGSGSGSEDGGEGGEPLTAEDLDRSDAEEIRDVLLAKRTSFETRGMDGRVEALEQQIADKFDADDFEDIAAEVEAL